MKKNLLILIVTAIVIGTMLAFLFPESQKRDRNAVKANGSSMRSYTTRSGFTFHYPENWVISESETGDFVSAEDREYSTPLFNVTFSYEPRMGRTLSDWISVNAKESQVVDRVETLINGLPALRVVQATSDHTSTITYLFERDDTLHTYYGIMNVSTDDADFSSSARIVDQIVQSVQFSM